MNRAVPRPRVLGRPDDAEDTLDERLQEVLAELTVEHKKGDDGLVADGDYPSTVGFRTPVLEKETPTKIFEDTVLGYTH
jgi:hypothetical protein